MENKRKTNIFVVVLAFLIGAGGMYAFVGNGGTGASQPTNFSNELAESDAEKFFNAFQLINDRYVEEVDAHKLLEGAINGMVETLEDPYSVYMDEETAAQFLESLESHFEGIGAEVSMTNGQVTIVAPFRDSPAEQAGLQPNDKIIKIDGETIEGLSLNEAVLKIRGEKGTTVTLTIERQGLQELIDVPVVRDEIEVETVRSELVEHKGKKVGIVEITSFSDDTATLFKEQLTDLEEQGMDGLIIDVRGNPGGYLNSVEDIGKLLIPENQPIVQIENREGERVRYLSSLKERKEYPIVGVIDRGSASASEILAAALKEAGGYDLVGETTFGKGTVQQSLKLGDGSELKLSLFQWLTSDGNSINKVGVEPTVEVLQPDYYYLPPIHVKEPLEYDMLGQQVANAQQMLKGLGFEPGRTDGYFGERTQQAVKAFQQTYNLPVSGVIDEETASMIHEQIVNTIRDKKNDRQLQTALELIVK